MDDAEKNARLIKFRLSSEEHDIVRLAAALRRSSMAAFAREVTIETARRLVADAGVTFPSDGSRRKKRSK